MQLQGGDDAARADDRLDDHPAQRIAGVLARVAGVRRHQEQRLADDGRRQAPQRRREQTRGRRPRRRRQTRSCRRAAGRARRRPSPRARRRSTRRPGRARRCRGTARPGRARSSATASAPATARPAWPPARSAGSRSSSPAGTPPRRRAPGRPTRNSAPSCSSASAAWPSAGRARRMVARTCGSRHPAFGTQDDAGPPGAPPLHARVQQHRAGGAEAEQEQQRERDAVLRRHVGVEDGDHAEDGDRAQVLQRGRGRRQREAAVRVHDRGRRADDRVQRHLRQQQQHQDGAGGRLAAARPRFAAPIEPSWSSHGVATAATGTIASMPTIATPSSPPAVRAAARRSPESMWPTSAGTSSEENIDPASRP